jgi:serine protease Do
LQKGDVIEQLNGQSIEAVNQLRLEIASMAPGTVAHLGILRNGEHRDVSVTLSELPAKTPTSGGNGPSETGPMQGVQVHDLTPALARDLGLPSGTKGVVVTDVADGTPAADAGLKRGDVIEEVNHHPVTNASEYERFVREAGKQELVLLVNRQGQTSFMVIEPE